MARSKSVVFTLAHPGKAADPFIFTVCIKNLLSSGEDLVSVSLMAHIPYDLVVGSIIDVMERDRQLNNTEAGTEMSGVGADFVNDKLSEFITDPDQIKLAQLPEIFRSIYFIKQPLCL